MIVTNAPRNTYDGMYDDKILELDNKISRIIKSKAHLVWLDEATFTARDFKRSAWSRSNRNIIVYDRT